MYLASHNRIIYKHISCTYVGMYEYMSYTCSADGRFKMLLPRKSILTRIIGVTRLPTIKFYLI